MRRVCFVLLAIVIVALAAPAQTDPGDSQTLKSLLAEVRLLRRDFHTASALIARAQILLHRLGAQQTAVDRAIGGRDAAQGWLNQWQGQRQTVESQIAQATQPTAETRENSDASEFGVSLKSQLEYFTQQESQALSRLNEAEEQLRVEQGKMTELQEQLDRIDRDLGEAHAD